MPRFSRIGFTIRLVGGSFNSYTVEAEKMVTARTILGFSAGKSGFILIGLAASAMLVTTARVNASTASVINWQDTGAEDSSNSPAGIVNFSGQASDAGSGTFWNNLPGHGTQALTNTLASDGTTSVGTNGSLTALSGATGINLLLSSSRNGINNNLAGTSPTIPKALLGSGSDVGDATGVTGNGPGTFTITGLGANRAYQLYIYGANATGSNTQGLVITISTANGATATSSSSGNTTNAETLASQAPSTYSFNKEITWGIVTGTADSTGKISGSFQGVPGQFSTLSGLQLDLNPVPEPASLGLLGLGGLSLLARRRRLA